MHASEERPKNEVGWGELKTQEKFQHLRGSVHAIMTGALFSLVKNIKQVMETNKVYGLVSPKDVIESIQCFDKIITWLEHYLSDENVLHKFHFKQKQKHMLLVQATAKLQVNASTLNNFS